MRRSNVFEKSLGVGPSLDSSKPYLMVLQHPVTTEYGKGFDQINETLQAIEAIERLRQGDCFPVAKLGASAEASYTGCHGSTA